MERLNSDGEMLPPALETGRHFIIGDQSVYEMDVRFTRMGPLASVIRDLASATPKKMPRFVADAEVQMLTKGHLLVAKRLEEIQLRTWWSPISTFQDRALLTPVWRNSMDGLSVEHSARFVVPRRWQDFDAQLWLLATYSAERDTESAGHCTTYLGIVVPEAKKLFMPPMSNIYPNGRICMGSGWKNNLTSKMNTVAEHWAYSQQWLKDSIWANDLRPSANEYWNIIVDEKGTEVVNKEQWPDRLTVFGNNLFDAVASYVAPSSLDDDDDIILDDGEENDDE